MEIKVDDVPEEFSGKIMGFDIAGNLVVQINGSDHIINVIDIRSDKFEFLFDNAFHEIKILDVTSTELKILLDGQSVMLKKYAKLTEIIEKSSAASGSNTAQNTISSQIPGRVISIAVTKGDAVKQGDNIVVLESMKMQVAIKSPRDGTIRDLKVNEGQSISRNDIVAILD